MVAVLEAKQQVSCPSDACISLSGSYQPLTLWPRATRRATGTVHVFWRAFIVCLVVYVQTSAHGGWKQQGWPTYALLSYILYMIQSDIQDIFAQVTSGASYHLFTMCTPFGTSTNVDCDPTVANTTDFLSAFLFSVNLDSLNCQQHLPLRWTIILKWAGLWEQPLQAACTNN